MGKSDSNVLSGASISIQITCYDDAHVFHVLSLQVPENSTIQQALQLAAQLYPQFSELLLDSQAEFGVYSAKCDGQYILLAHDRIEFYQPLTFDPMESRRRRAEKDTKERKKFLKRRNSHKTLKKTI